MKKGYKRILKESLEYSFKRKKFSSSLFFDHWFKENGISFFFLFKKNLKVTNIQYAELVSLLKTHMHNRSGSNVHNQLQFVNQQQFKDMFQFIANSLVRKGENNLQLDLFVKLYSDLLKKIVVLDVFFGSCAVYIPNNLIINAETICAESGYIHSCGQNVYIRNILKATYNELKNALKRHLKSCDDDKKYFFAVYAHEDFTEYEGVNKVELKDGLDDVKIYLEKFYLGDERLVSVLRRMKKDFKDKLEIPDPGNFKIVHKEFRVRHGVEKTKTLWLIVDRSLGTQINIPGSIDYFIVYNQEYINENPFHLFDENKPAWINHTTIPHTLAGAMVNITRPWINHNDKTYICDPFIGSGTVLLEALKLDNVHHRHSDINPIAKLLAKDNLYFFSMSPEKLVEFLNNIKELSIYLKYLENPQSLRKAFTRKIKKSYEWLIGFFEKIKKSKSFLLYDDGKYYDEQITTLCKKDFFDRLLFYVALKAHKRNIAAFERKSKVWISAFIYELLALRNQIMDLYHLREMEDRSNIKKELGKCKIIIQGDYSKSTTLSYHKIRIIYNTFKWNTIKADDVRKLKKKSCNVIITDPPYGFNTSDKTLELADLYRSMIKTLINALKPDGQLVFCLPDRSRTGKQVKFFTDYGLIIHQVLSTSESLNREVVNPVFAAPTPNFLFRPPFYWQSERALRRLILHFRIR